LSNFILFSLDQLSALVRDGMHLNMDGDTSLLTESSRIHPDFFGKHIYYNLSTDHVLTFEWITLDVPGSGHLDLRGKALAKLQ
jgi:hypothetical protein